MRHNCFKTNKPQAVIKIDKPQDPPVILVTRGKTKRAACCGLYTRYSKDYQLGDRKFSFDASIYGHKSVKQALLEAQYGKCCFCESKIGADGDVEHFRPKAGCCQGSGQPIIKPGYYWLAYEWDNLLLACPVCNQRFKRNYFPLADPTHRAKSHEQDLSIEEPLFINPAERDPAQLIAFRKEIPYAIKDNQFGKETISALGLGREILNERRRDRLELLTALQRIVDLAEAKLLSDEPDVERAKVLLREAVDANAEFAAMARCAVAANFYLE